MLQKMSVWKMYQNWDETFLGFDSWRKVSKDASKVSSVAKSLCSRNFQNVKLRLDLVEIWWFYNFSDLTWNQFLLNWNGQKMWFLTILKGLNFDFGKFKPFLKSKIHQNSKFRVSKVVKMAFFEIQILPKLISHKIEWQVNSCIVDLNFTF